MPWRTKLAALSLAFLGLALPAQAQTATLEQVRQRGSLQCGVSTGLYGFSFQQDGKWAGFDVDFCRALAAAVLGSPDRVNFVPLSAAERFDALKSGRIDILSRNSTWTLQREAELGLLFAAVLFHDGQSFMVHRSQNITSALELVGKKVCVQAGTTSQNTARDFFAANAMSVEIKVYPDAPATLAGFAKSECEAMTTDNSGLFAERLKLEKPGDAVILPDIISKEPLGPVTRADDLRWHNIVKWVAFALINAEELGISSRTLGDAMKSSKPDVMRLLGVEGGLGKMLGLSDDWARRAIEAVGSYAEFYERNVGTGSKLGIPRGLNQLWSEGGILYAPPVR
ncbi:MAG: amino acid ABC transporter substrate-bindnig protein [Rhizobiales bacterium PAR1]|nr:MAG: amino acid ABC transporter substrate-bindnig protein [Rhizobiales bacterium PAR1]